jgi:hypothetical protein
VIGVEINGTPRYILGRGSWSIDKRLTSEVFRFTIRNDRYSSLAYRPEVGDAVYAVQAGGHLVFGGQVLSTTERRAERDGPIEVEVEARDWSLLAQQVRLTGKLASGPILTTAYGLFVDWLQLKGVTWLGPTSGGPTVGDIEFRNATVAEVFSRLGKEVNYGWRINGDKELGFIAPGDLPFPFDPMEAEDFLMGSINISQVYYERATRLILTSGGTGDANHVENHTGDGVKSHFLLNVEPKPDEVDDAMVVTSFAPTEVVVNGVTHPLNGSPWTWDPVNVAVYNSSAAVPNGHVVSVSYKISFPATVRVWEPSLLFSSGQIDVAYLVDKLLTVGQITDVAELKRWGDVELLNRGGQPRRIKGQTRWNGFYPLLTGTVVLPEHNVNAEFLIESVRVHDIGIDPELTAEDLVYDLDMIEGGMPGRQWEALWSEMNGGGSGGGTQVSGTGGTVTTPVPTTSTVGVLVGTFQLHLDRTMGSYATTGARQALGSGIWLNGDLILAGSTVQFRVLRRTDNSSTTVTAVLRRLTGTPSDVAAATATNSTTFVEATVSFTPIAGWHAYELQVYGSDANNAVYAVAAVDVFPP